MFHIVLHFLLPLLFAVIFWRQGWLQAFLWLMCGLVIDLDHLLADPIYDPSRCSIGFHPLHSEFAFAGYCVLMLSSLRWPESVWADRARLVLFGVLLHLILDAADCVF